MTTISLPQAPAHAPLQAGAKTTVGNYFVANYPPFGFWKPEHTGSLRDVLSRPPSNTADLGLYVHIPFCRKRCHFCYFKVYTDKNAAQIRGYLDAVLAELESYARTPLIEGRSPRFIYFGGGTPSYLSIEQLRILFGGMRERLPWDAAQEVAFEAEPGTLQEHKVHALRELGVTRLSLGIEHMDDRILEINGRAHRSKEVHRAYGWARAAGFDQINVDLIAGMVEETQAGWHDTVRRTIDLAPDSVTIYQMEVPYNTTIYQRMLAEGSLMAPVADWDTKRQWVREAFEMFEAAGYSVVAATTVVKNRSSRFLYRQGLFDGTDLLSVGVSSFGYLQGVNYQNEHHFDPYVEAVSRGERPTYRAYPLSPRERLIREVGLQLKGGSIAAAPFIAKFGQDPREAFAEPLARFVNEGYAIVTPGPDGGIAMTREGLLRVDRLIFEMFEPEHRTGRFA